MRQSPREHVELAERAQLRLASSVQLRLDAEGCNTEVRYRLHGAPAHDRFAALRVVFAGFVEWPDLAPLADGLVAGRYFLPAPLDLPDLRDPDLPLAQRPEPGWHELIALGTTYARPTDKRPLRDFLAAWPRQGPLWRPLPAPAGPVLVAVPGARGAG